MKKITEKLRGFLPALKESVLAETNPASFDFIRPKNTLLKEFEFCLREGNVAGIYCPLLGNGMFLVGVEKIIYGENGSALIVFFTHDMSGHALARRRLSIEEITMIVPFNNAFVHPAPLKVHKIQLAS
jgi:hypothetical protein